MPSRGLRRCSASSCGDRARDSLPGLGEGHSVPPWPFLAGPEQLAEVSSEDAPRLCALHALSPAFALHPCH